jgi:hypothetical protein
VWNLGIEFSLTSGTKTEINFSAVWFMAQPRSPKSKETNDSCRLEFWRCQTVMCGCSIGSEFGNLKTPAGKDRKINLTYNQKSLRSPEAFS